MKCDRKLLAGMRQLNSETLKRELGNCLQAGEINGILKRRDKIVALFDKKIATDGEGRVLFDMPPRGAVWSVQLDKSAAATVPRVK